MKDILKEENQLTGCMVGRLAMNNTWEISKIDDVFYPEFKTEHSLTREEILIEYANFAQ